MVRSAEVDEICNRRRHILELLERWTIVVGFQTCIVFVARVCSDVAIFYIFRRQNIYGGRPERRIDTSFIMLSFVLWPRVSVEYQMTSEDGLNLAPVKGF